MIIYKATNKINGLCYIGQTIKTLKYRKSAHEGQRRCAKRTPFHEAIEKYGKAAWEWEELDNTAITREELDTLERHYIALHEAFTKGYNTTEGGHSCRGWKASSDTRKKLSEAHMGHTHSEDTRKKMSRTRKGKNPNWINPDVNVDREEVIQFVRNNPKATWKEIREKFGFSTGYFHKHFGTKKDIICQRNK